MAEVESLNQLIGLMNQNGAHRIFAKKLAPNDNSKNQVYLGGDFSALNIIPHGEIYTDGDDTAGSKRDRAKAKVKLYWIDKAGKHLAPNANLILYPKYPEIRMSGFLKSCKSAPSHIMAARDNGRTLFLGITLNGDIMAHAIAAENPLTAELDSRQLTTLGVFLELPLDLDSTLSSKASLLNELRRIYQMRWITSQKLAKDGLKHPYAAANGGGYTLEAELGITPNGFSEPDYLGWEVKQYGVNDFTRFLPKSPVTLMTPEPNAGFYKDAGAELFVRRFGYADKKGKPDRINFGGIYACGKDYHADTGVRMLISGYDSFSGKISDLDGGIQLVDRHGEVTAEWKFKSMMQHWNRKHAQAAYVPSLMRAPPPQYAFGQNILLCEQTDFMLFLKAFADGIVYYDPAIKIENASSSKPLIKRRSQFRVKHSHIAEMYHQSETVYLDA
jgi:hypothetical protein